MVARRQPLANPAHVLEDGVIPADTLRRFEAFVTHLDGDPEPILREAGIEQGLPLDGNAAVSIGHASRLLDLARTRLGCADLGLRLAAFQQGEKPANLFELVMRNSATVGDALAFSAAHCRTYSGAVGVALDRLRGGRRAIYRLELLGCDAGGQRQVLELMVARMVNLVRATSGGRCSPLEVWFSHAAQAPSSAYRRHFGCPVRFGQPTSGILLDGVDLDLPNPGADRQMRDLATFFIEHRFPAQGLPMTVQVRKQVEKMLDSGAPCTIERVADRIGLHQRTMQRRLRDEDSSFEFIRDEARREVARKCLTETDLPLSRLAEMLGYSEVSALSRSCRRWFAASPRVLRKGAHALAA